MRVASAAAPQAPGKLRLGPRDDAFEREADRVAEAVTRGGAGGMGIASTLARNLPAPPPRPIIQRLCPECQEEQAGAVQRKCAACAGEESGEEMPRIQRQAKSAGGSGEIASDFTSRLGAGAPLDPASRSYFEPRFGHDFGDVRIHTGPQADTAAASVQARAFTLGRDVVFAAGEHDPGSAGGQRLLAHELTHVVQQSATPGMPRLQRKCQAAELGTPSPDCTPSQAGVAGWQFLFKVGCDDLLPGEEANITKPKAGSSLKIHGFASQDGPTDFNSDLSCHRANKIADMARRLRADCPVIGVFKHGESPVSAPGLPKDMNPPGFWRSVIIEEVKRPLESGESWLDPGSSINTAWALYRRAKVNPTQPNLMLVFAWRSEMKDWLTSIGKTLAPQGAKLTRKNLDDYRRFYASAEQLWQKSDELLALHKFPDADKETYQKWAVGPGKDQGDSIHAPGVPAGAKYHVDIFGEGYFKGAINIGRAERTSTTGIRDSRVPNLIYRNFSFKDANALPIADHAADLVTSENGPIGMPGLAEEIARIIAPGGTIVLYNPVSEEGAHDKVAKAVGGTVTKEKSDAGVETVKTTIVAPGP